MSVLDSAHFPPLKCDFKLTGLKRQFLVLCKSLELNSVFYDLQRDRACVSHTIFLSRAFSDCKDGTKLLLILQTLLDSL